jgi:hypothetical protein
VRHYATSRKLAGSRPDEVNFFTIYLILPFALGLGVHSTSNKNEYSYQKQRKYVCGEYSAVGT